MTLMEASRANPSVAPAPLAPSVKDAMLGAHDEMWTQQKLLAEDVGADQDGHAITQAGLPGPDVIVAAQTAETSTARPDAERRWYSGVIDKLVTIWQYRAVTTGGAAVAAVAEKPAVISESQIREDEATRQGLAAIGDFLRLSDLMPVGVDFYLCSDPEGIGISRQSLEDMEQTAYKDSGYGDRAEGKDLFKKAYRGYADEDRLGDLRFVILTKTDEESGDKTPIAFFDYFRAGKHLFPECDAVAREFRAERNLDNAGVYIVSKLVRDPRYAKEMMGVHRYALASTMVALANLASDGIFIETQAQPATRLMVSKAAKTYIPDLEVLLDQDITAEEHGGGSDEGGNTSKMLLYIPSSESRD